jgi:hypothetical protein
MPIIERTDDNGDVVVFEISDDLTTYKSRLKETNLFHSFNGKPAVIDRWGKYWYVDGKRHREDGPAVECATGTKHWHINDNRHRENGPAVEYANGNKEWWVNGKRHREDGPAIEWANGDKAWYVNGKYLTKQEFNKWRKNNV